jgi:hypothetical protein
MSLQHEGDAGEAKRGRLPWVLLCAIVLLIVVFVEGYRLGRSASWARPSETAPPDREDVARPKVRSHGTGPAQSRAISVSPRDASLVRDDTTQETASHGHEQPVSVIVYPEPGYAGTRLIASPDQAMDPRAAPWAGALPADSRNIARGKPVAASDDFPVIGDLPLITDGSKSCEDGDFVELGPGPQFVQVDLLQPARIDGFGIWHYCQSPRTYYAVQVWVSDSEDFANAISLFNNDADNSLGNGSGTNVLYLETHLGLVRTMEPVTARYVRAYSQGNTSNRMNHYIEVEVYGRNL